MPEQQLQLRIVLLGKEESFNQLGELKRQIQGLAKAEVTAYNTAKAALLQKNAALKDAQLELKKAQIAEREARAAATKQNAQAKAEAIQEATAIKKAAQEKVNALKQQQAEAQKALILERQRTEQERRRAIEARTNSQQAIDAKKQETEASKVALNQARVKATEQQIEIRRTREEQRLLNQQIKEEQRYLRGLGAPIGSMARLRAETSQLRQEANRLNLTTKQGTRQFKELQRTIDQNARKIRDFDRSLSGSNTLVGEYSRGIKAVAGELRGLLVSYVSIYGAIQALGFSFRSNVRLDSLNRSLQLVSGSTREYRINQDFLNETIDHFGLSLFAAETGFRNFYAASTKAGLSADRTRQIFSQLSEVAANLRLTQDQETSAFVAFEQIISKGVVSTEELRRQLGNAIPGAFEIAAQSMGMTTAAFNKLVASGQLSSVDFLPKFAEKLVETFGNAGERVDGLQQSLNRFNNLLIELSTNPNSGINSFFSNLLDSSSEFLKEMDYILEATNKWSAVWDVLAGKRDENFDLIKLKNQEATNSAVSAIKKAQDEATANIIQDLSTKSEDQVKASVQRIIKTYQTAIIAQQGNVGEIGKKLAEAQKIVDENDGVLLGSGAAIATADKLREAKEEVKNLSQEYGVAQGRLNAYTNALVKFNDILNNPASVKPVDSGFGGQGPGGNTKKELKHPYFKDVLNTSRLDKFWDDFFKADREAAKKAFKANNSINITDDEFRNYLFPEDVASPQQQADLLKYATNIKIVRQELEQYKDILGLTEDQIDSFSNSMGIAGTDQLQAFNESLKSLVDTAGKINDTFSLLQGTVEPIAENILTAIGNNATGGLDRKIEASQERLRELESDAQRAEGARKEELEADLRNERDYQNELRKQRDEANQKYLKQQKILSLAELGIQTAAALAKINIAAQVAEAAALPMLAIPIVGQANYAATVGIAEAQRTKSIIFTLAAAAAQAAAIASKKYALGGKVTGPSHDNGGVKFYNRSERSIEEMEGGEFVTKRSATANNLATLDTINRWGDRIKFSIVPQYAGGGVTPGLLPLPRLPLPSAGQSAIEANNMMMAAINAINNRIDRLQVVNNAQDTNRVNNRQQSIKQVQNF